MKKSYENFWNKILISMFGMIIQIRLLLKIRPKKNIEVCGKLKFLFFIFLGCVKNFNKLVDLEFWKIKMEIFTKVLFRMRNLKVKDNWPRKMEMYSMENGKKEKHQVKVFLFNHLLGWAMMVCGNKTKNMEKDYKFGMKVVKNMKEILFKVKWQAMVFMTRVLNITKGNF